MKVRKYHIYATAIILLGVIVTTGIMVIALRKNVNLYYTTKDVCFNKVPMDSVIYLDGVVKHGSVQHKVHQFSSFSIIKGNCEVSVTYKGDLPALFKEGREVVLRGTLVSTHSFVASRVLARHNNVYIPKKQKGKPTS